MPRRCRNSAIAFGTAGTTALFCVSGCIPPRSCKVSPSHSEDGARCLLSAEQLRSRQDTIGNLLEDAVVTWQESPDGFVFELRSDDDTARHALEAILLERRCCGFVRFVLAFEPQDDVTHLELRVEPQGKALLRELLEPTGLFLKPVKSRS